MARASIPEPPGIGATEESQYQWRLEVHNAVFGLGSDITGGLNEDNVDLTLIFPLHLADSVEGETSFGLSTSVGVSEELAREDHTHGTPANPVPAHEAATDPHPTYTTDAEATAIAGTVVTTHTGAAN